MHYFTLRNSPLADKTVLLRVDFNVPLNEVGNITDNRRIKESLPTIRYLLAENAKMILLSHLGRPEGEIVEKWRLDKVAKELSRLLKHDVRKISDCIGPTVHQAVVNMRPKEVILLENLRFHVEEEKNDRNFARELASLGDYYINDAFSVSHRAHASVEAITEFIPSAAGFLLEKEIHKLSAALHPQQPLVLLLGGSKVSDKVPLIEHYLPKAEKILIGGAMAFSFLKAKKLDVGMSKMDVSSVKEAEVLLKKAEKKIVLPIDIIVADKFSEKATAKHVLVRNIPPNAVGLDIGPETIKHFQEELKSARTVIWNGPMGVFEWEKFSHGTKELARFIASSGMASYAGGGETAEALAKFGLLEKFTHVSTGGGAALEFLSGKRLPGLAALERNFERFSRKK
ncbi:phosphoglycerate kinase [Candidatus Woesearchaeota archaeon]|nr:phosphoglycerate kinase [Candidatus Woesearchaeota archaeon]